MPSPALIAAGVQGAGLLLNKFFPKGFGGQTKFNMTDPSQFKDDIVMNQGDLGQIRSAFHNRLSGFQAKSIADIKQAGAAGRLPEGAVIGGIAGTAQRAAEGAANLEPGLQREKRKSILDFSRLQQRFDAAKMAHEQGNAGQTAGFNQQGVGNLGRIAILAEAGLLN